MEIGRPDGTEFGAHNGVGKKLYDRSSKEYFPKVYLSSTSTGKIGSFQHLNYSTADLHSKASERISKIAKTAHFNKNGAEEITFRLFDSGGDDEHNCVDSVVMSNIFTTQGIFLVWNETI